MDDERVWESDPVNAGDVEVKGYWDDKLEGKGIGNQILLRGKERGKGKGKAFVDRTEVAVMVRTGEMMNGIMETFDELNIPYVAEGRSRASPSTPAVKKTRRSQPPSHLAKTLTSDAGRRSLSIFSGCSDGDLVEDVDFAVILEGLGMFPEDVRSLTNAGGALFVNANDVEAGCETSIQAVRFTRRWNKIFKGSQYMEGDVEARQKLLLECLGETNVLNEHEKARQTMLSELCSTIANAPSIQKFVVEAAINVNDLSDGALQHAQNATMKPVSLITMHRAKGNEFDDIYLAGWNEGTFPSPGKDMEEERRLAFVALTRARQHVTISYASRRRAGQTLKPCEPSRFLEEIKRSTDIVAGDGMFKGMHASVTSNWEEMRAEESFIGGKKLEVVEKKVEAEDIVVEKAKVEKVKVEKAKVEKAKVQKVEEEAAVKAAVEFAPKAATKKASFAKLKAEYEAAQKLKAASTVAVATLVEAAEAASPVVVTRKGVQKTLRLLRNKKVSASLAKAEFKSIISGLGVRRGSYKKRALSQCTASELGKFVLTLVEE